MDMLGAGRATGGLSFHSTACMHLDHRTFGDSICGSFVRLQHVYWIARSGVDPDLQQRRQIPPCNFSHSSIGAVLETYAWIPLNWMPCGKSGHYPVLVDLLTGAHGTRRQGRTALLPRKGCRSSAATVASVLYE